MWFFLYNLLNVLFSPVILLTLMAKKRCRKGLGQRLGLILPELGPVYAPVLWVHAVSLGEASAVIPLVHRLHDSYPTAKIFVSTITETGREVVVDRLSQVAHHCYFPLDWPWSIRRVIRRLQPAVFIVVETELWPNVLRYLRSHGVPTILVNGRLSSRSYVRYHWIRPFMKQVLGNLTLGLVQSGRDAERFMALGLSQDRVKPTGNMKFDQGPHLNDGMILGLSRAIILERMGEGWIVAGSTHAEEERILLQVFQKLLILYPSVKLLLAPRHIERTEKLEHTVRDLGLKVIRRTTLGHSMEVGDSQVLILDSRGELAQVYGLATLAFVGGTLIPVGGHNLLEPARWGKPVIFGPFTDHCQETATVLLNGGGGIQVQNEEQLLDQWIRGFADPEWRKRVGMAAKEVVSKHQGVVEENFQLIKGFIDGHVNSGNSAQDTSICNPLSLS